MKGDPPPPQFFKCQSFHSNAVWNKKRDHATDDRFFEYFDRLIVACNTSPAHWHIEVLKDNDFWMFEPPKNWMFFFPETTAFLTAFKKVNLVSSQRAFWSCFYSTLIQCWCVEGGQRINRQIFLCVFFEHVPS